MPATENVNSRPCFLDS